LAVRVPVVEIYSKPDCCLCDEAKAVLTRVRAEQPFELVEIDIGRDPGLLERYGTEIPVVFVGGRKAFKYRVDEQELRRRLARAAGGEATQ
jgi:glutaredoxin